MAGVKTSIYGPIHDPIDSIRNLVVKMRAAIAKAPIAPETSMNISIDVVGARQCGELYHLPVQI